MSTCTSWGNHGHPAWGLVQAQAIVVLYNGVTTAALLSILLSCLSTAFTATMIAYDIDTNAANRKINPGFYGYATRLAHGLRP